VVGVPDVRRLGRPVTPDEIREILARELYVMREVSIRAPTTKKHARSNWYLKIDDIRRDVWRDRADALVISLRSSGISVTS
jgi:hypothetical protein